MPPPGRWRAARVGREPQEFDGRATHLRTVDGDRVVSVLLKTRMESLTSTTARAALRLSAALAVFFAGALTVRDEGEFISIPQAGGGLFSYVFSSSIHAFLAYFNPSSGRRPLQPSM